MKAKPSMTRTSTPESKAAANDAPPANAPTQPAQEASHPDHVNGIIDDGFNQFTPFPDDPLPPLPFPQPPLPRPQPVYPIQPNPPSHPIQPQPPALPPINICAPVSGKYRSQVIFPIAITVRVDVDRFFPQRRISVEASTATFPSQRSHIVAEVTSDRCLAFNRRRIIASIIYRNGSATLLPGDSLVFEAARTTGLNYSTFRLTLMNGAVALRTTNLTFVSQFFDEVEFEIDSVENAGTVVTTYTTDSHPNRPANLTAETLSLATVYQRAGFNVKMSPNTSTIPLADAGSNGTWSDAELHNAMVTYWSRFANKPQWALWVLYAARHDSGRSLGGIMFDDIGTQHRQGTAIFTDSFIQDVPPGDAAPAAWRNRMVFWTAVHEMGHAFNLAHSWQKALGNPWLPLADEPEARSYMNYPFRVVGGQTSFFSDFAFRFSDSELQFMRHAPRRFVQMGNADWFVNHAFEAPASSHSGWRLTLRTNHAAASYRFMEPVAIELKLTNNSGREITVEEDLLADGRHCSLIVQREGSRPQEWRAMQTVCHEPHRKTLAAGESIYGTHLVSASTQGWLIDEPGFYKVQAAVQVDGEIIKSKMLRIYVATSSSEAEHQFAPDYFTEDVGRVLAYSGAPSLTKATGTLEAMAATLGNHPAALHARLALSTPQMRPFKMLDRDKDGGLCICSSKANLAAAAKVQKELLVNAADAAAGTFGHIAYYGAMDRLAHALKADGDTGGARIVRQASLTSMKKRGVLDAVMKTEEHKLASLK